MIAIRLRTEYLQDPIGIDIITPRFYWNAEGGLKQTAYRIKAMQGEEVLWDSGKTMSSSMTHIPYKGRALKSRDQVTWSVTLWDEEDREGETSTAVFEMGLLEKEDWTAKWITGNYAVDKKKRYPVDSFKKTFESGKVEKARLYVTACGLYEGQLNGKRIGSFVLAPGHTDYRKRIQYQTYDVTDLIKEGDNEITFDLADGWFRGSCGAWGLVNQYGTETKLLAQLEITEEEKTQTIVTDGTWAWSNDGPIRFADNKDGEVVEACRMPSYDGMAKVTTCSVSPSASNNVEIREKETFTADVITTPSGKMVLDFHQNIAGYITFRMEGREGQKLKLRFGEMLDKDGEFTQTNIQCRSKDKVTPLQQVEYTCKDGVNEYKTKFAIFGFQYVLVEADMEVRAEDFTAIAVYSDVETTASFDSSNPLLNALFKSTLWSLKNNSADVPTDCPTRERHGWTGDSQIFTTTANYLTNYYPFARKHIRDMVDFQSARKDGAFPQIAPCGGVDFYMETLNGSVGWADAGILIPYRLYKQYGDRNILEENYDSMKKYARFMIRRIGKLTLLSKPLGLSFKDRRYAVNYGQSYGEWAEPADVFPNDWKDMVLPHPEVSTAYTAYVLRIMAKIAEVLGKKKEAKAFSNISEKVRRSYQAMRRTKQFPLDTDRQAMLVRPLYMDLLEGEDKAYARERLIKALENYGYRLGTGFLSTPLILHVLSEYDLESAYRLLENEEMPGWLFMPKMGATTIWESWEGTQAQGGIASLDHYSKGACLEWVFSTMCGIQMDGENHFKIAPVPGGHFTYADMTYQSIYGKVSVRWEKKEESYTYHVSIPSNCTAILQLPGRGEAEITAGTYEF